MTGSANEFVFVRMKQGVIQSWQILEEKVKPQNAQEEVENDILFLKVWK